MQTFRPGRDARLELRDELPSQRWNKGIQAIIPARGPVSHGRRGVIAIERAHFDRTRLAPFEVVVAIYLELVTRSRRRPEPFRVYRLRHHQVPVTRVTRGHPEIPDHMKPRRRNRRAEPGEQVERFEQQGPGAVSPDILEREQEPPVASRLQPPLRERRPASAMALGGASYVSQCSAGSLSSNGAAHFLLGFCERWYGRRPLALSYRVRRPWMGIVLALAMCLAPVTAHARATTPKGSSVSKKAVQVASPSAAKKPVPPKKPAASKRSTLAKAAQNAPKVAAAPPKPIPEELRALGPMSVGHPHGGFLVNGERLPNSDDWVLTVPSHGYGTRETNAALTLCIGKVRRTFPGSPKVMLGSLSAERGGFLPPHKSHRSGRDADVYFFRQPNARWVKAATETDIDLPRTWALLRCFATQTDVDMILIDRKVQGWLEKYATSIGENREWLQALFHDRYKMKTALVRHVPGHVAHMHVRFTSPKARRLAVQHYDELVAAGVVVPEKRALVHVVAKGDTLLALARRYGMTVEAIQQMNRMQSTLIRVGQKLTMQQAVDIRGARDPVAMRGRPLPPGETVQREPLAATPDKTAADATVASTPEAPNRRKPDDGATALPDAATKPIEATADAVTPSQASSEPTPVVDSAVPPGPPPRAEPSERRSERAGERPPASRLPVNRAPS
jgi:LysM repeat protein